MTAQILVASHKKIHKPQRKTRSLWEAIATVAAEYELMTVRQLYYQMEMRGHVSKDESDYDKVQRACLQMRRQGYLSYDKIVDSSRERRTIYQYSGLRAALEETFQTYRRNYWLDQQVHVEVWCEKDALTSVMNPVCQEYGVAYQALRGFDSESFAYESARDIKATGKPAHIYYFGDHDPSGWWIVRGLEPTLRSFGANVKVFHVGVTPQQVQRWRLPTRRAKTSDSRLQGFVGHFGSDLCTEVDAIPPDTLTALIRMSIERNIDKEAWARVERSEELERDTLKTVLDVYGDIRFDSAPPRDREPIDAVHRFFEEVAEPPTLGPCQFAAGQRVGHTLFGEGVVVSSKLVVKDEEVTVAFTDKGVKQLLASFAKLQKCEVA